MFIEVPCLYKENSVHNYKIYIIGGCIMDHNMDRRLKIPHSAKADCGFRIPSKNAYTITV